MVIFQRGLTPLYSCCICEQTKGMHGRCPRPSKGKNGTVKNAAPLWLLGALPHHLPIFSLSLTDKEVLPTEAFGVFTSLGLNERLFTVSVQELHTLVSCVFLCGSKQEQHLEASPGNSLPHSPCPGPKNIISKSYLLPSPIGVNVCMTKSKLPQKDPKIESSIKEVPDLFF